ncbi:MAG: dipeptidase [Gammaproteobacteria bacterium]|nr:dipeptidase [Gammaproteobacteria bacterium]
MTITRDTLLVLALVVLCGCATGKIEIPDDVDTRIAAINARYVFADMHAHPSRFHRENIETITAEEIDIYRRNHMDLVVANISSDMAFSGGYTNRDGSRIDKGEYKPEPGEAFSLAMDRLGRLNKTIELGYAVHAASPTQVIEARQAGHVAVLPALEGADALEGSIDNFRAMHAQGLRLLQIVHFRANELGHIQTYPYSPGGLTEFGREVIREANTLGIVIDLAHSNTETIMDVLELSRHPVIFSHGGARGMFEQDRAVSDDEIRAIAARGGVIGIWPHGRYIEDVAALVDFIEYVIDIGGIDHVGIGSDLRGTSALSKGFGNEANFRAIAMELLERDHSDEAVGKIMGGNFFRAWQTVVGSD